MRDDRRLFSRRQFVAAGVGVSAALAAPGLVRAEAWPTKPIRMLAGSAAGGQTDQFARVYGEYLSRELGQTAQRMRLADARFPDQQQRVSARTLGVEPTLIESALQLFALDQHVVRDEFPIG